MSLGTILLIILVIALLGGFSGRFGGYCYGFGHGGVGVLGTIPDHHPDSGAARPHLSDERRIRLVEKRWEREKVRPSATLSYPLADVPQS